MDNDPREILERQAEWQRARADRPWAEKLRVAVVIRHTMNSLRKAPSGSAASESKKLR